MLALKVEEFQQRGLREHFGKNPIYSAKLFSLRSVRELLSPYDIDPTHKFSGMFNTGDPDSADNEKIDADLARAYLEDYERSK